ncbi:TMEM175 family protein [Maribacter arcticus]|uniref:TMEM175 family protein n=1 Tax=Maribacter arcticus TaxID=561365 RepID=UPI003AB92D4C
MRTSRITITLVKQTIAIHKFIYEKNRVIAFYDTVFSIAMTHLVLEIDVPSSDVLNQNNFLSVLSNRIPNFIGFLVSFIVIAIYWVSHLRVFSYVRHIKEKLIWLKFMSANAVLIWTLATIFCAFVTYNSTCSFCIDIYYLRYR